MNNKIRGKVVGNPATTPMRVPDFEQNDPKRSDYIKNRPFYEDNELLGQEDILWDGENAPDFGFSYSTLSIGDTVLVEVERDGKTEAFEDIIIVTDDQTGVYPFGGEKSWDSGYSINGLIVKIFDTSCDIYTTHDYINVNMVVRVYKKTGMKQLDEKFIPDTIARVADIEKHLGTEGKLDKTEAEYIYSQKLENLIFEPGSIGTSNGSNVDGMTNRIRTKNYIRGNMKITLPTNYYVFAVYYYNATSFEFVRHENNGTQFATIVNDGTVARVVVTKKGNADLTPSDIKESVELEYLDGKISELETKIDELKNSGGGTTNDTALASNVQLFTFEQGSIEMSTGAYVNSPARIRTKNYIYGTPTISLPSGFVVFAAYYYDPKTLEFKFSKAISKSKYAVENNDTVAKIVICKSTTTKPITVDEVKYSCDNEDLYNRIEALENESDSGTATEEKQPYVIFGDDFEVYDTTEEVEKINFSGESNQKKVMSRVYDCFDELAKTYPNYVTTVDAAEVAGIPYPDYAKNAETGENLYNTYMYKFESAISALGNSSTCPKKKLFLIGGLHGQEIASPFNLYIFAKRLCDGTNANYFKLRSTFDIYIIPCLCGYGMLNLSRMNGNGVNVNRNFPVEGWTVSGEETNDYTGAIAGSEFETKIVMNITNQLKPDFTIDHHSYATRNTQFYSTVGTEELRNIVYQSAVDCSYAFVKNFPEYFGSNYFIPIKNNGTSPNILDTARVGTTSKWLAENGYDGATVEISNNINYKVNVETHQTEYVGDGNYQGVFGATVFSIGEYTLRNQIFKFCNYVLQNKG